MTTYKTEFFVGIDPGLKGGIAILDRAGVALQVQGMPATDLDVINVFREFERIEGIRHLSYVTRAILERAAASPQMGAVSAFKFGIGYGALRMALTAVAIPFDEVTPLKWQRPLMCVDTESKARLGTKDKNITKRRAQELFPHVRVTHLTADALLLAEYCRRFWMPIAATIKEKRR